MTKEWKPTHSIIAKNDLFGKCVMVIENTYLQSLCIFDNGHLRWCPDYWLTPITSVSEEWKPTHHIKHCDLFLGDDQSLVGVRLVQDSEKTDSFGEWVEVLDEDGCQLTAELADLIPITSKSPTAPKIIYKCPNCDSEFSLIKDVKS